MNRFIIGIGLSVLLGGCMSSAVRTASFAPPPVVVSHTGNEQDIAGAIEYAGKYIDAYRQAGSQLSNGRQWFDIPSVVAGVGGATASALGASPDVAIGTGAFTALSNSAKGYYKPSDRADVYYDAVEALTCAQQVALGMPSFKRVPVGDKEISPALSHCGRTCVASVRGEPSSREFRVYVAVKNAVLKVENIARGRLSKVGAQIDVAQIIAAIQAAQKKKDEADAETAGKIAYLSGEGRSDKDRAELEEALIKKLVADLDACTVVAAGAPTSAQ